MSLLSAPNKIFISYRRDDTRATTGRLYGKLTDIFGRDAVFIDVDNMPIGVKDFRVYVRNMIAQCSVVLVIIGPRWLTITDSFGRRRLDDPNDLVRQEIEEALAQSALHDTLVVPVLADNATTPPAHQLPPSLQSPRPLPTGQIQPAMSFINAASLRPDPDFNNDLRGIVKTLESRVHPMSYIYGRILLLGVLIGGVVLSLPGLFFAIGISVGSDPNGNGGLSIGLLLASCLAPLFDLPAYFFTALIVTRLSSRVALGIWGTLLAALFGSVLDFFFLLPVAGNFIGDIVPVGSCAIIGVIFSALIGWWGASMGYRGYLARRERIFRTG